MRHSLNPFSPHLVLIKVKKKKSYHFHQLINILLIFHFWQFNLVDVSHLHRENIFNWFNTSFCLSSQSIAVYWFLLIYAGFRFQLWKPKVSFWVVFPFELYYNSFFLCTCLRLLNLHSSHLFKIFIEYLLCPNQYMWLLYWENVIINTQPQGRGHLLLWSGEETSLMKGHLGWDLERENSPLEKESKEGISKRWEPHCKFLGLCGAW